MKSFIRKINVIFLLLPIIMKIKFALLIAIVGTVNLLAQDPHFSQWNSSKLTLNPSLTGANGHTNIDIAYRNQWPQFEWQL